MIVLDNGDAIRGIAEVASKLSFTISGYVGTTATSLAQGQIASTEGDLYASGADATVVTSITVVNTDSAARTFTLYFLESGGGTSWAITPVSLDLGIGYSCYADGQRIIVLDKLGQVVTTFNGALTDLSDVDITAAAQGEILQFDGSNWVDFAVGTAGNPLKSGGAGADVAWYTGLTLVEVASAVNRIQITNSTTGEAPVLEAEGSDTNVDLHMTPKGTGRIELHRTLPSTAAQELTELEVIIDASAQVSTSSYHALEIETTGTPAGKIVGLGTVGQVAPILQSVASPATPDQGEFAGRKTGGGASWADGIDGIEIFVADDDEVYVGSASQFDEIEVIFGTAATKSVVPTFWYNTAADAWTQFFPLDSTDGFIQSGDITWLLSGISGLWTNDGDPGGGAATAGYWIKIIRTRVADPGSPNPTTIKIGVITEYEWSKTGALNILSITDGTATLTGGELDGATIDSAVAKGTWTASGTWQLPAFTLGGTMTVTGQGFDGGSGSTTFNTTGLGEGLEIISTQDGTGGAIIICRTISASPAAGDWVGGIYFRGNNSTAQNQTYGGIIATADNVTAGTEASHIDFYAQAGSTNWVCMALHGSGNLFLRESSAALADVTAFGQFWVKDDAPNTPWFTDDAGTDKQLAYVAGISFSPEERVMFDHRWELGDMGLVKIDEIKPNGSPHGLLYPFNRALAGAGEILAIKQQIVDLESRLATIGG